MFAKNHDAYPNGPHDGQVVVKQSWIPELVPDADAALPPDPLHEATRHQRRPLLSVTRRATAASIAPARRPAFIMFRLDPATPDTDEGWVYATVSPAGQVTAAGRVACCMGCHETSATHERLYGVPLSPSFP